MKYKFVNDDNEKAKKAEEQWERITKHLNEEQKQECLMMLIQMSKSLFFHEPWLLKHFTERERKQILNQFTEDEQIIMLKRFDLEFQHWKEKES